MELAIARDTKSLILVKKITDQIGRQVRSIRSNFAIGFNAVRLKITNLKKVLDETHLKFKINWLADKVSDARSNTTKAGECGATKEKLNKHVRAPSL